MVDKRLLNSELIRSVFHIDIRLFLQNRDRVYSLYKDAKRAIMDMTNYNGELRFKLDIIENYLLFLNEKEDKTSVEEEILTTYKTMYIQLFNYDYESLLDSKIYQYYANFFTDDELEEIKNKLIFIPNKARKIYCAFNNRQILSPSEINYLMAYLSSKISSSVDGLQYVQEDVIKKILKSGRNYGYYAYNFLLQYFAYRFSLKNGIPSPLVYLTNGELVNKDVAINDGTIIAMDQSRIEGQVREKTELGIEKDVGFLKTFFYLLACYKANYGLMNDENINGANLGIVIHQIFTTYLSGDLLQEYLSGYKFREFKRAANIDAWRETFNLLNKFAPHRIEQQIKTDINASIAAYEHSVGYKISNTNNQKTINMPGVESLNTILVSYPKLLSQYPYLLLFFTKDGNLKNLQQLVATYSQIGRNAGVYFGKKVDSDVFLEYFLASIEKYGVNSYPLNTPLEEQASWFAVLCKIFIILCEKVRELNAIKDRISLLELYRTKMTYDILINRIKNYLDSNKFRMQNLDEYNKTNKYTYYPYDEETLNKAFNQTKKLLEIMGGFRLYG